jgi:hypothetical protein
MDLFPRGELDAYLDKLKLVKLATLPFYPQLAKASEIGIPSVEQGTDHAEAVSFLNLADTILTKLPIKN